ncbi:restriction endonuclease subunit S [Streptococcus salivarius]|uniref:restriction endonuclease subunit S n=1 Tax=Streptococcus salivarius TaxID=1304 RepID=UPI001C029A63|nr:restriction endonuclease subunit S [Streptococcus salivarius]MBT9629141.1 restriction endonuclease subunit S [Streptococcus salivarius]
MKKQTNVPSIIFSRFNEDSSWKSKKFKELLDTTEGIRRGPFGSALKKELFVQNSEYVVYEQQNAIYDHFNTRYRISEEKYHELKKFILLPGDFIMSGAGTIGKISLVPEGIEKGVFNQALIRLRVNKNTDKEFFLQWMRSPEMQNKLTKANPASAMVNLVPMSEVKEWDVIIPSLDEQSAIGSFFRTLDDLLSSYKDNLANYQSLKATMLSKMFPKAGQTVPEIRLDGFKGEWELLEINDLADDFQSGGTPKTNVQEYWNGDIPWIQSSDLETNCLFEIKVQKSISEKGLKNSSAKIIPKDSIAVVTRVGVGKLVVMRHEYATSQDFLSLSNLKSNIEFTAYLLYRLLQKEVTQLQGTSIKGITKVELLSKKVLIPSLLEQQAIGTYFTNLDNLISAHQEKISQLETFKKKLLQDMFI